MKGRTLMLLKLKILIIMLHVLGGMRLQHLFSYNTKELLLVEMFFKCHQNHLYFHHCHCRPCQMYQVHFAQFSLQVIVPKVESFRVRHLNFYLVKSEAN